LSTIWVFNGDVGRWEQQAHGRDGGGEEHNDDGGDVFSLPSPTESFKYALPQEEGRGDGRGEAGEAAVPVFVYQRDFLDDDEYAALLAALKVRSDHVPAVVIVLPC
jgi:hypothetical protein